MRLREYRVHALLQVLRVVIARYADRYGANGGRRDKRILAAYSRQFFATLRSISDSNAVLLARLVGSPTVRENDTHIFLEEPAIQFVIGKHLETLVQSAKFIHDGLLHQQAAAADGNILKVK